MTGHVDSLRERIGAVVRVEELSQDDLWARHGPVLWQAKRFVGQPTFYPVYRAGNLYSYSPLALILAKNRMWLDAQAVRQCRSRHYHYLSGRGVLDREIERIGGPVRSTNEITSCEAYAERLTEALLADVAAAERANPGHTNIVLCGGKDSLNLLLLPWRNPTYAASAPPNFDLVRRFVADNDLDFEVVRLEDLADERVHDAEVLENGCRNHLKHCRWGVDLQRLARRHEGKVIYWKGQIGAARMSPHWKTVGHPPHALPQKIRKAYKYYLEDLLPEAARRTVARRYLEPRFRQILWRRCAMWQGAHVSLLRAVADCLVLSAYHGPEITKVFDAVDMTIAVPCDVRDLIGARLLGRPVKYPATNPGPGPSRLRMSLSTPERFLSLLEAEGVEVRR